MIVTAVCDEEVASIGTARVAERYRAHAAIVSEPTELRLALAHKGFVGFEIETKGRAAHGSRPTWAWTRSRTWATCSSASSRSMRACGEADAPLLGSGSLHASVIEGGQEFQLPERCLLKGERRTIPGETDGWSRRAPGTARGDRRRDPRRRRAAAVRDARGRAPRRARRPPRR